MFEEFREGIVGIEVVVVVIGDFVGFVGDIDVDYCWVVMLDDV